MLVFGPTGFAAAVGFDYEVVGGVGRKAGYGVFEIGFGRCGARFGVGAAGRCGIFYSVEAVVRLLGDRGPRHLDTVVGDVRGAEVGGGDGLGVCPVRVFGIEEGDQRRLGGCLRIPGQPDSQRSPELPHLGVG